MNRSIGRRSERLLELVPKLYVIRNEPAGHRKCAPGGIERRENRKDGRQRGLQEDLSGFREVAEPEPCRV